MHSTGLPITTTNGNPNEGMPMSIYKQQFQTDLRAKMPPQDEVADHDPSVGGLAAALGNREPLDDAEAILAENLAAEGNAEVADESDPSATEQTELFSPQKSSLLARLLGLMAKTLGAVSLIGSGVLTITPTGPLATAFGASLGMTAGNWVHDQRRAAGSWGFAPPDEPPHRDEPAARNRAAAHPITHAAHARPRGARCRTPAGRG